MRYFTAPIAVMDGLRSHVMTLLDQPNGRAAEPWSIGGDHNDGALAYVALGEHHTTGWFAPLIEDLLATPGVEEISETTYRAAQPQPEQPEIP